MQFIVTDGKRECSILATDPADALGYYQNRTTEAFGRGSGLWISKVRLDGLMPFVALEWLDWTIPGLSRV